MPIIEIKFATPRPRPDAKPRLARMASELTARLLGKRPELIATVVEEVAAADWFIAGASVAETGRPTLWFEIRVTDATNTKAEKAAFVRSVFEAAGEILGALDEKSYVHVHDVRGDAYGYGGRTQEHRFVTAEVEAELKQSRVAEAYRRYGVR